MAGLVRQPGRAGAVTDGIETLHIGLAVAVDGDVTAVHVDAQRLQPDAVGVGGDADRRDADLGLKHLGLAAGLDGHLHALAALRYPGDLAAGAEFHAALLEGLLRRPGHLLVLDRHDAVEGLDHGHLGPEGTVEAAELDADGPRADDDDGVGHGLRGHGLAIGPDAVAVGLETDLRNGPGAGPDGQHDRLGLDRARSAGLEGDDHLRRSGTLLQLRRALDDLDFVLLHQIADAGVQLFRHRARAGDDGGEIEADLVRRQAVVLQMGKALVFLAGLQQGLGRDTAPVQADAAQVLTLDDGDLLPQLAGADGGDIAARAGTDDDKVEFCRLRRGGHVRSASRYRP